MAETGCLTCRELLSEGLDLCVRARKMDEIDRRKSFLDASFFPEDWVASGLFDKFVEEYNRTANHAPISTRSATLPVWVLDQYEKDLAAWEGKSRHHLMQGCVSPVSAQKEKAEE